MFWSDNAGQEGAAESDLDGLIRGADPAILVEQWADHGHPGRLSAPIGSNENGPVNVDLRELGPHALVSGDLEGSCRRGFARWPPTTVRLISLFTLLIRPAERCSGIVRSCRTPSGSLNDASVLQIKPALAMLSAEMDRREALLSSLDCDTIESLERQGRSSPFPYLVIAVDRVEQLGGPASQPDADVVSLDPTMELLSLSDRGQQLGVHLLLGSSSNQRLSERIALQIHAGRAESSTLTVGHAPPISFSATLASSRPEVVVKSFTLDEVVEVGRAALPSVDHDDLERLTTLIANAHEFSGDPLPSSLS